MTKPVTYSWDGEAMVPLQHFGASCDRQFIVGETYQLIVHENRSQESHNHYFAAIHDAWMNLPELDSERFATAEHLRKWALIKAGYRDERSVVCASKAEALRVAAFIKPMDEFAVVLTHEAVVTVYTAQSQSKKAMGADAFQASKQKVLDVISAMIGVEQKALTDNAGLAA